MVWMYRKNPSLLNPTQSTTTKPDYAGETLHHLD